MKGKIEDIIRFSQSEKFDYPDVFTDSYGLNIPTNNGITVPSWDTSKRKSRRVSLSISTFCGISPGATHLYGKMIVDGVLIQKEKRKIMPYGTKECPMISYSYRLTLQREVTQKDKDIDKENYGISDTRFDGCDVGDITDRFDTEKELIQLATQVFDARFEGDWELWIECTYRRLISCISKKL